MLYDRADSYFDADGRHVDGGYFEKKEYATFFEYGISDRFTLVGRIAWQDVVRLDAGSFDAAQGYAASEIGVRMTVWRSDRTVAATQISALAPGDGENIADHPLGDGAYGADVRALIGRSIGDTGFTEVQAAYRWRDQGFQDEARLDATIGWRPRPRILVLGQSFSTWSVTDPMIGRREFSQHKLQASVGYATRFGDFHIGGYLTPAGRNAIDERAVFLGWWRRF